ncbi:MAG: DUF4838 domain-containing protein [Clostridia bacterium]|nr:DUF4838 domain-containing protein [Clostridia bacterium]
MKKIISVLLTVALILSFGIIASAANADGTIVFANGKSAEKIVISASATDSEKFAAKQLQEHLQKITGENLTIALDSESITGNEIVVGKTNRMSFEQSEKAMGFYEIKSDDSSLYICGTGSSGTLDGVYRFLSDYCGYEVYEFNITSNPSPERIDVDADIDISYTPFFEYRKLDTMSTNYAEYARAHSLNGSTARNNGEKGVYIPYLGTFCHTLSTYFCSRDKYFDEHPEYFAFRDGKRIPDQLCLTNPDVLKIVTDEVLSLLKREHNPEADIQIVSLTQDDNQNYCTCDKCAALDKANDSQAGTMLTFANAVAESVKNAGYDNVAIDTFAYQYTRHVPSQVKPADNVIVRLCSIECCYGHTIDNPACKENAEFLKDLEGWSNICDRLYIWDYVNNYSETFCPFANFQVLQRNVQIFYENGAKGLYEEGNYYMDICNGEFYELRSFLLAKLMENPYRTDFDELMGDYLNAVYGAGGEYLHEYINIISEHSVTRTKHLHIRQQPRAALPRLKNKDIKRIDYLWESAKSAAETEEQLNRIERSEISWQYWKCSNFKREYSPFRGLYNYMSSHKALSEKIIAFGNTAVGEGGIKYISTHPCRVLLFPCDFWETKHDGLFYDKFDSFVEKLYNTLDKIHN